MKLTTPRKCSISTSLPRKITCCRRFRTQCTWIHLLNVSLVACSACFYLIPGASGQHVADSSASLVMTATAVWQGESSLMRCISKPKFLGISKVLWVRREKDGTMRNVYLYNRDHPKATGSYKQFTGRISGWLNVGEGTHYLNMNKTLVSDTADYYCIITDDNYADKISPVRQLTVNVKHFNHSVQVNGSSESFSSREDVTLEGSEVNQEIPLTCSVISAPMSYLSWTAMSGNDADLFGLETTEKCSVYNANLYICTSYVKLKMDALMSKRTDVCCHARCNSSTLTSTSDACVTLVYENFLPPPSALTLAKTRWVWIMVAIIVTLIATVLVIIIVLLWRRRSHRGNKKKPSAISQRSSYCKASTYDM